MSDTVQFTKDHLTKWRSAYFRAAVYVTLVLVPVLDARFEKIEHFTDLSPVQWIRLALACSLAAATVLRSFVDKTETPIGS